MSETEPGFEPRTAETPPPVKHPVIGYFAVGFGLLGIFTYGPVFAPLSLICSLVALFMGQFAWAFVGLLLAVVGVLTSPTLLLFLGLGALALWFGLPWFILPWF